MFTKIGRILLFFPYMTTARETENVLQTIVALLEVKNLHQMNSFFINIRIYIWLYVQVEN